MYRAATDVGTGPTQGAITDVSPDPAATTPLEHDPSTNPESAEPPLKKRKIPRLAASSDLANAVMTGSPTVSVDAADSTGRRSSSGELLPYLFICSCLLLSRGRLQFCSQ